jgi:DNA modification methylase
LQLGVIERCVKLWSAPGDLVFSPFAGIGSEGYQSLILHRQFLGIELKESYWRVACANLNMAEKKVREDSQDLFSSAAAEPVSKTA